MNMSKQLVYVLPRRAWIIIRKVYRLYNNWKYRNLSNQQIFSKIYAENTWGISQNSDHKFYSGGGSHDPLIIEPYISAVIKFLARFDSKCNIVDIGCGDFNIGSQLRHFCNNYVACDIVPELIEYNKNLYKLLNVDFRVLDLVSEELPEGEIIFCRQVLQHLSNSQIITFISKLRNKYKYLILTEHLPDYENFKHNIDKISGPSIRSEQGSGVVLTSSPFNLKFVREETICSVRDFESLVVTKVYQLL